MATIEWPQGTTHIPLSRTLQDASGDALPLSGITASAITAAMSGIEPNSTFTALSGSATINNASLGQMSYTFAPADVATPGEYLLVIIVTFGTGDVWRSFPQKFIIIPTS